METIGLYRSEHVWIADFGEDGVFPLPFTRNTSSSVVPAHVIERNPDAEVFCDFIGESAQRATFTRSDVYRHGFRNALDAEREGGRMTSPFIQIIRKPGGISPCRSSASSDWMELGREYRRAGHQGVVYANGANGRAADELLADLDPEIQATVLNNAETNHPLLDALSRELNHLPDRYTGTGTRFDLEAENERLREEIQALESRLTLLDPDPDEAPRMEEISSEAIRDARAALNPTQEQAARRLGVAPLSLSRWENGRTKPTSPAHVRALVAMLNEAQAGMTSEATPF